MMYRTQIQLADDHVRELKKLAAETGRSVSDLVREGVEAVLRTRRQASRKEQFERAARAIGAFASGRKDLAERHDEHFADAAGSTDGTAGAGDTGGTR